MRRVRLAMVITAVAACGSHDDAKPPLGKPAIAPIADAATPAVAGAPDAAAAGSDLATALPASRAYPDLAAALVATIPADARVIGFGELHARTDRAATRSSLARFTEALPAIADRISDLVVETWVVDPKCGAGAAAATTKIETEVKRPAATKSEIAQLADAARAAKIQPIAMQFSCADYKQMTDPVAMLSLVTRELGRQTVGAVGKPSSKRPWVAVYGGALHNDRFPDEGTEEWSYASRVEDATKGRYVEIDIIVPELAVDDKASQRQPWFPLAAHADAKVHVWKRGERSFVVVLPESAPP